MGSLLVEYAKSGRSACRHCKLDVAKGEIRVGIVAKGPQGYNTTKWHHSKCLVEMNSLAETGAADITNIKGFTALKAADQESFKLHFQKTEEIDKGRKRLSIDEKITLVSTSKKPFHPLYNRELWEDKLSKFNPLLLSSKYKDVCLPSGWKSFETVIIGHVDDVDPSEQIAAFDFDGCLANTSIKITGADAWSLMYSSIPQKLQTYHQEGYKLVIFTNESNIDRWTKSRQKAVDSKIGRLKGFLETVKLPMQVFIGCGKEGTGDPCRKPAPGMWEVMERLNKGVVIHKSRSFYVGDAAGRVGDHSAADLEFAQAVGIKFYIPEDIFL